MLQGMLRAGRLQWAMRKDVFVIGGLTAFYFSADHLILQRTEQKLRALGLYHEGNMTSHISEGAPSGLKRNMYC